MSFFRTGRWLFLLALLLPFSSLSSLESEETLAIRRIATCYYEKDFKMTKRLIEDFFKASPSSIHLENLYVLLADVYLQEKQYERALALYQMLLSPALIQETFVQNLHCLYSLKNFYTLKKTIEPKLEELSDYAKIDRDTVTFYYAEALFKEYPDQIDAETQGRVIALFKSLFKTSLEPYAKLSLAYLYSLQKEYELASNYFTESANAFPEMKEKLLFLAAENQTHFDLDISSKTFYQIKELDRSKSGDAIYNWLILLFHSENFQEIMLAKDEILSKVPSSKIAYAHLILGKIYFSQKKFEEALHYFNESVGGEDFPDEQEKEALFLSALSCYHLSDEERFRPFFSQLEKRFRSSKEYPNVLFLKAKLFQQKQEYGRAQSFFNKVTKYKSSNLLGAATFESALCYFFQKNYQKAHDSFAKFLHFFNDGQYAKSATYYLLQSSSKLHIIKPSARIKQQLINDYLLALKSPHFFEDHALTEVYLKIGKLYLELGEYEKLLPFLETYIEKFSGETNTYQAHLLLALAYKKGFQDLDKYILHLEKAASYKIPKCDLSPVSLHLFQAYFQQAQENEAKEISHFLQLEKATCNLHRAIRLGYPLPKEHFIWLIQTYYQRIENTKKISTSDPLLLDTAEAMATFIEKFPQIESIQEQHIRFNYSKVLGLLGRLNERVDLLKTSTEKLEPSHPLYIQSLLELGLSYELLNQAELAIAIYEEIISGYSYSIPIITFTAKLRLARLLTQNYLKEASPELYNKISKYYRDLHLSKSFKNEPLHLEAALDNALLQNIKPLNDFEYKPYLEALLELKDNFSRKDNLLSKEYHELREHDSDKNKVYEAYMMFVDAKILHLQAKINLQLGERKKADEKASLAKTLIERLQNSSDIITPYLEKVSLLEKEAIDKENVPFDLLFSYLLQETLP